MAWNPSEPYYNTNPSLPPVSPASDPFAGIGSGTLAEGTVSPFDTGAASSSGSNWLDSLLGNLWGGLSGGNTLTGIENASILGLDAAIAAGNIGLANTEGDVLNQGYNLLKRYQNITPGVASNAINQYLAGFGPAPFQSEAVPGSLSPSAAPGIIAQYGKGTGLPQNTAALNALLGPQNASRIINQYEQPLNENLTQNTLESVQGSLAAQGLAGAPGVEQAISQQALAPYAVQEQEIATGLYGNQLGIGEQNYTNSLNQALNLYGQNQGITAQNYQLNQELANQQNLQRLGLASSDYWNQLNAPIAAMNAIRFPQPGGYASLINPAATTNISQNAGGGGGISPLTGFPTSWGTNPPTTFPPISGLPGPPGEPPVLQMPPYNPPPIAQPGVPPFPGDASATSAITPYGGSWDAAAASGAAGGFIPPVDAAGSLGASAAGAGSTDVAAAGLPGLTEGVDPLTGAYVGTGEVASLPEGSVFATGDVSGAGAGTSGGSGGLSGLLGTTAGGIATGAAIGAGLPLAILSLLGDSPFSSAADQETVNNIAGTAQGVNQSLLKSAGGGTDTINTMIAQAKTWEAQNPGKNYWEYNPQAAAQLQEAYNFSQGQTGLASEYTGNIFGATGPAGGANPTPTNYTGTEATSAITGQQSADKAAIESLTTIGAPTWLINAILTNSGTFTAGGQFDPSGGGAPVWDWSQSIGG